MPLHEGTTEVYRSYFSTFKNVQAWQGAKLSRYRSQVAKILDQDAVFHQKSDSELRQLGSDLRQQALSGKPLDDLLVPAFALVRETASRLNGTKHYPVQLLGGIAIHHQHFVEMATGEGKTLVSTCPAFLNALVDRGVHIVTVNDYLAQRDSEEMGKIHSYLGLSVGVVVNDSKPHELLAAYRCSITYATNKEIGFDFLRDELRTKPNSWYRFGMKLDDLRFTQVLRKDFHFAIVDEADSVLIDDARTPLIIAEAPPVDEEVAHEYMLADKVSRTLKENEDFTFNRAEKKIEWLRTGEQNITKLLGGQRSLTGHRIDWHESCLRALKANVIFHRDVDYVVENGEVVIVDENTGRKMPGRQWEEGLHQAVSAKESLEIKGQNETMARTTYQILFNRYQKLAGMTGTCMTDAIELAQVYGRGCLRIPTNRPCIRQHPLDSISATEEEKWKRVVEKIRELVALERSVLVGTRSVERSLLLSNKLQEAGIPHTVLNAHQEEREAEIVKQAGQPGRVTVATNMAGRGTDIKLDEVVRQSGGLFVLGTERHESRRVDNQLAGRAGRQGDPGTAQFFVSLEDPLILRYRPKVSRRLAKRYKGRVVQSSSVRRFFRRVQLSIERQHRKIRSQLIKYDRERAKYNRELGTA
ncbi:preprotein translocase subunit SecA [bacterium]|nr:preprotein translocase subunit SecA [bacterium]